jgi:hypothetical protein
LRFFGHGRNKKRRQVIDLTALTGLRGPAANVYAHLSSYFVISSLTPAAA